jgi:hypothetical protein
MAITARYSSHFPSTMTHFSKLGGLLDKIQQYEIYDKVWSSTLRILKRETEFYTAWLKKGE